MNCEIAQQQLVLAQYGELSDDLRFTLERHLQACEHCMREWNAMLLLQDELAHDPLVEPSPNLLAASRMRLDEALDALPARSLGQRLTGNAFRWLGFLQGAPALATLLLGAGFVGGHYVGLYQAARAPKLPSSITMTNTAESTIASVSGIVQTPDSQQVQVSYNKIVPETIQGSLDDPAIRNLLMLGTKLAANNDVHADSVALLANECRAGHSCDGGGIRHELMVSLRYDKSAAVRLKALGGLQPYVAQDQDVRDAVLDSLMHDTNASVREQAVSLLMPVGADSSVRQVLRTVSAQDVNPAIRNASFQVLQSAADIQ